MLKMMTLAFGGDCQKPPCPSDWREAVAHSALGE